MFGYSLWSIRKSWTTRPGWFIVFLSLPKKQKQNNVLGEDGLETKLSWFRIPNERQVKCLNSVRAIDIFDFHWFPMILTKKSTPIYALPIDRCGACRTAQKPRHSLFLQKRNESCQPILDQFPRNRDQDGFTGVWGDQRCLCKFFRFFLLALKRNYMKWSVYVSILIWVARSCACKRPAVWPCLHIFTSISEIPNEHILHQKLWILFLEDSLDQSGHVGGHENMETYEKAKLQSGPTLNKHWSTSRCLQCNDAFFTNCLLKAGTNSGPTHVLPQILTRFPTIDTKTAGQVWVECNLVKK